jgi:uncharacterized protein (DUF488 family)
MYQFCFRDDEPGWSMSCARISVNSNMPSPVFTIGHSNHPIDVFMRLLMDNDVEAIVDTRSHPRSKFAPQYDAGALRRSLRERRIEYIYLGKELGGRPEGNGFYDEDGRVFYSRVAESAFFQRGMRLLDSAIRKYRLALLCSEENPSFCHRRLLIARVLREHGIPVDHIRGDGSLQSEEKLLEEESAKTADSQLELFEHSLTSEWKSIPSVLPRKRQNSSSES